MIKLDIPDVPLSLNRVLPMHWTARRKYKLNWLSYMYMWLPNDKRVLQGCHAERRKMRVTITLFHSRLFDRDNAFGACKVIFDALRDALLLYDDRPEFLESHVEQQKYPHRMRHTLIEIEPA